MTIALVAIARNEEHTVERMLASARTVIDTWTIIDTGSTDRTKKVIRRAMKGLPGDLLTSKWRGFAHNRTEALDIARGTADYLLALDADHTLHIEGERPELTADEYRLRVRGPMQWRLPLLLKADRAWRYEGVAHSYLTCTDGPTVSENLEWLSIDGGGGVTPEKLARDLHALTAEHARNPLDPRTVFYLARTHDDLDHTEHAIHYYRQRAQMNGWLQERFYARYRLGVLLVENVSYWDGARELLAAAEMLPERQAEPLRALANAGNAVADKTPPPADGLFVHTTAYRSAA